MNLDVCEYSGLTRYIMGMLDEVEILEGDGLKDFAIDQMEQQLQLAKAKREKRQQMQAAALTA